MAHDSKHIAVIGAGVVGLSTALSLQQTFPSCEFTLFADKFNEETLSSGAGGIFRPEINVHPDSNKVRIWCHESLSHFLEIVKSTESSTAGIQLVSGYHLNSTGHSIKNKLVESLVPDWRILHEKEMKLFPKHFKDGVTYTTVVVDCRHYLPWMMKKFENSGGTVIRKHIASFDEITNNFDIIVNCTGLGAKEIAKDDLLMPIRGQTIMVKAPWIKQYYYGDDTYIIPGVDYVTLGGIKDYGSWNIKTNENQKKQIWDKCTELVPSLQNAEIMWDWVGLRPYRPSIKIDISFHKCKNRFRMILHNYGHGGHGVALSWGTAQEATRLLKKMIDKDDIHLSKL